MKKIKLVGLNHKRTPVNIREEFYFEKNETSEALKAFLAIKGVEEAMLLSTCNRTEAYFVSDGGNEIETEIIKKLAGWKKIAFRKMKKYFYKYSGHEAVKHIFKVACGLDSMVIGENEVTGQFKDAFSLALDSKTVGRTLNTLYQAALSTVKKVKNKTAVSNGTVSVSYCAVSAAVNVLGSIDGKKILIIGSGEMANSAAVSFMKKGAKEIDVLNKTYSKAVDMSKKYGGRAFGFESMTEAAGGADIILSSTASKDPILRAEFIKGIMRSREKRPLLIIDIAVPRDVEDAVKEIKNVHVYNIDDLKKISSETMRIRKNELIKAEGILSSSVEAFEKDLYMREVAPAVNEIKDRIYRIALQETENTAKEQKLSPEEKATLEKNTIAVVDRIIRKHMGELKKRMEKGGDGKDDIISAIKEAFKIYE